MMYEVVGTDPKDLSVFAIFAFDGSTRQMRRLSEGAGAATFRWCGYDWRDLLYLGEVSAEAKAAYLVHLWYVVSAGPSKTSLASAERPRAASIALRDHR